MLKKICTVDSLDRAACSSLSNRTSRCGVDGAVQLRTLFRERHAWRQIDHNLLETRIVFCQRLDRFGVNVAERDDGELQSC